MKSIYLKLIQIQNELKAPKSQYNSFGKYNYRNAEDIMEALKPVLQKYKTTLYISDDIAYIEGRHYLKATATIVCTETGESIQTTAMAREEESKKGMDGSQVTGASSSYARKYCLNGLFLIDDTKDSDFTNQHEKGSLKAPQEDKGQAHSQNNYTYKLSEAQINRLYAIAKSKGYTKDIVHQLCNKKYKKGISELNKQEYDEVCQGFENAVNK